MFTNFTTRNTHDAPRNLLSKTDRKQQTINYGYDALYRLTGKTYPDQTAVGYTYDPLSRLTQVTDPSGAYSFTYDNLGCLLGTGTQYSFLSTALNNSRVAQSLGVQRLCGFWFHGIGEGYNVQACHGCGVWFYRTGSFS